MKNEALLEVESLARRYRGSAQPALADLSFRLGRGQSALVLGPSGSGKSTLLNLLAGLDRPDEGRVVLDGEDLSRLGERLLARIRGRKIGVVFQHHFLPPGLTARETVATPLLWSRGERPRDALDQGDRLLEELGLARAERARPVERLSGGQRQRVAFARAIAPGPVLLLADEPVAHLDPESAARIWGALAEWAEGKERVLIVASHERPEHLPPVDLTLRLENGRRVVPAA